MLTPAAVSLPVARPRLERRLSAGGDVTVVRALARLEAVGFTGVPVNWGRRGVSLMDDWRRAGVGPVIAGTSFLTTAVVDGVIGLADCVIGLADGVRIGLTAAELGGFDLALVTLVALAAGV